MVINGITTALALVYCNTIGIKHRLTGVNIDYF